MWHIHIPGKIITELSVRRSDMTYNVFSGTLNPAQSVSQE